MPFRPWLFTGAGDTIRSWLLQDVGLALLVRVCSLLSSPPMPYLRAARRPPLPSLPARVAKPAATPPRGVGPRPRNSRPRPSHRTARAPRHPAPGRRSPRVFRTTSARHARHVAARPRSARRAKGSGTRSTTCPRAHARKKARPATGGVRSSPTVWRWPDRRVQCHRLSMRMRRSCVELPDHLGRRWRWLRMRQRRCRWRPGRCWRGLARAREPSIRKFAHWPAKASQRLVPADRRSLTVIGAWDVSPKRLAPSCCRSSAWRWPAVEAQLSQVRRAM